MADRVRRMRDADVRLNPSLEFAGSLLWEDSDAEKHLDRATPLGAQIRLVRMQLSEPAGRLKSDGEVETIGRGPLMEGDKHVCLSGETETHGTTCSTLQRRMHTLAARHLPRVRET